ncbi:MAG: UDP-N-acetylglucosamine 2-epimerase (non-hydrolyzing) [Bacteroidetes bacterium]|nr:UDP-N-acetylglucosamine 2-epimerase (non-hydrolyzing) [Bacteroidota bacterium]
MKTVLHVVGARPNFMKLAPVYEALKQYQSIQQIIVHTGQHFDYNMSDVFFEQLGIPQPHINLDVNGGSVISQIGNGILKIEKVLINSKPDLVCIYGDINATAFTSLAASKLNIKIAHIEAGLRSFDLDMPEETNRMIADSLSNYYFTPSKDADENLLKEGKSAKNIFFVGNVMIDTLKKFISKAKETELQFNIPEKFALVTLHRPSNVDDKDNLIKLLSYLEEFGKTYKIIFPIHPRTKAKLSEDFFITFTNILFVNPLSYFEFVKLQMQASLIITDSGGIQEESTYLGIPCFTLRNNTERPITIFEGTNTLVGADVEKLKAHLSAFENGDIKNGKIPELWDGNAGKRIAKIINESI